jgi:ABC-type branched-subunit amino acid transport system substrate-binding protein
VASRRTRAVAIGATAMLALLAGCKGNTPTTPAAGGGGTSSSSGGGGGGGTGASQPGLTKTTVTVGTVATITGLVPGLFAGAPAGVKAYAAYINSQGGINGRMLVDSVKDDAFSCSLNSQGTTALASSAFAMVGSFSVFDSCAQPIIAKNPTLPYIGVALNQPLGALPNDFSPDPTPPGYRLGPDKYIVAHYGVKRVGFISGAGAQEPTERYQFDAAKQAGASVIYTAFAPATQSDFTSNIIRMRNDHVDWVDLDADAASMVAEILQAMHQQNYHPKVITAQTAYDAKFFSLLSNPSIANGVLIPATSSLFLGEDASTIPAVSTFNTWMKKTGTVKPDLYALFGWTSAELFAQALKAAGPNPTRTSVIAQLAKIHSFTGDGLFAPTDPASKLGATCWVISQIENSTYKRIIPAKGFQCSPGGYYVPPGG